MKKRMLLLVGIVLSVIVPIAVNAGTKSTSTVSVSATGASGAMGDARASADSTQYIGCQMYYNSGNSGQKSYAQCFARDSAGNFWWCQSGAPEVLQLVPSITIASYISLGAPTNGGTCSYVQVSNISYDRPLTP